MGRGILRVQLELCDKVGEQTGVNSVWKRREGFNFTCTFAGAIKRAFGIFLFQYLSITWYQESLGRGNQRKNTENILRVKEIPRDVTR
ncbi:MAG: hypothetical protein LBC27_02000 [Spirochaetaceae bacterium]|jgi:hypothetical protein|nr:hypothetical protein [Spirochaetaceae bacterium]